MTEQAKYRYEFGNGYYQIFRGGAREGLVYRRSTARLFVNAERAIGLLQRITEAPYELSGPWGTEAAEILRVMDPKYDLNAAQSELYNAIDALLGVPDQDTQDSLEALILHHDRMLDRSLTALNDLVEGLSGECYCGGEVPQGGCPVCVGGRVLSEAGRRTEP